VSIVFFIIVAVTKEAFLSKHLGLCAVFGNAICFLADFSSFPENS
jgi:hypothetical protein